MQIWFKFSQGPLTHDSTELQVIKYAVRSVISEVNFNLAAHQIFPRHQKQWTPNIFLIKSPCISKYASARMEIGARVTPTIPRPIQYPHLSEEVSVTVPDIGKQTWEMHSAGIQSHAHKSHPWHLFNFQVAEYIIQFCSINGVSTYHFASLKWF